MRSLCCTSGKAGMLCGFHTSEGLIVREAKDCMSDVTIVASDYAYELFSSSGIYAHRRWRWLWGTRHTSATEPAPLPAPAEPPLAASANLQAARPPAFPARHARTWGPRQVHTDDAALAATPSNFPGMHSMPRAAQRASSSWVSLCLSVEAASVIVSMQ